MRYNKFYLLLLLCVLFSRQIIAQSSNLLINEFLASSVASIKSPVYGEYADWIEIFNKNLFSIDLGGYLLTDDLKDPSKWKIPSNTIIPANGYLLIWADGKNSGLHTNFKLGRDGEWIGLYNIAGILLDSISFGYQYDDISFGRFGDAISTWGYFKQPTPGSQNILSSEIGIAAAPVFSLKGGFYKTSQSLVLSASGTALEIRYTTDGTLPVKTSMLYSSPIRIDSTVAIRACSFEIGKQQSHTVTNTYFINEAINLPIISVVTDPANLLDNKIGIYITGTNGIRGACDPTIRNVNQDWERPINIELYEVSGKQGFNQEAGIKIFGGCSRTRFPQKSFAIYARSEYGKGSFDYKLFQSKPIKKFESFLLRSSADDQVWTMTRDALAQSVLADAMDADIQAYQPSVVFINGKYWGIHNIREKFNEHYLASNFGVDPNDVNILESNSGVAYGSNAGYTAMVNYTNGNNMSLKTSYEYIKSLMDVNQYIDYMIGHIYLAERDWPGNNIKYWRANSGQYSKWRWFNFDLDQTFTFGWLAEDMITKTTVTTGPSWPNPDWSTKLFRNLLKNDEFKNEFIQRYAWHENTTFKPERLIHFIDSLSSKIAPEIPRHIKKWGGKKDPDFHENWNIKATFNSVEEWNSNVDTMRIFSQHRGEYSRAQIIKKFGLSGSSMVTLQTNSSGSGTLKIVDKKIKDGFSGRFYNNIPLKISAIPVSGKKFSYWEVQDAKLTSTKYYTADVNIILSGDVKATANFEEDISNKPMTIVINEINYKSATDFDSEDWVELFNPGDVVINLSGWQLMDSDFSSKFVFPSNVYLGAKEYIVICKDSDMFAEKYSRVKNRLGNFKFGLSSDGEKIILTDVTGRIVDEVTYSNQNGWPINTNGSGRTIELKNSKMDNNIGSSWLESKYLHGSPGAENSSFTFVEIRKDELPVGFYLNQNYPNPFNPTTLIRYSIEQAGLVQLKIYNVLGQLIRTLVNQELNWGEYETQWDGKNDYGLPISSGIYIYTLSSGNYHSSKRMVLLK